MYFKYVNLLLHFQLNIRFILRAKPKEPKTKKRIIPSYV